MTKIINKTVIPIVLVLLVWYFAAYWSVGAGSACDVIGKPCSYPKTLIDMTFLLGPLIGGLYIFFVSRDLKFVVVFCCIFYILLVVLREYFGF